MRFQTFEFIYTVVTSDGQVSHWTKEYRGIKKDVLKTIRNEFVFPNHLFYQIQKAGYVVTKNGQNSIRFTLREKGR